MNFNFKKLPPFKWFVLQNFPFIEADFDAITYYQLLCKIVEYLNKVIDENNAIGEQTENLTNAFNELQDYVNHYFDNLDVQEEINNKLDEMAEGGQLTDIIAQYLQLAGLLCYNTVNDMKNATNLVNGSFAKTYGFYNINDGGNALYKIRTIENTDVVNNIDLFAITNSSNLVAELVINEPINALQLGFKNNGIDLNDEQMNVFIEKYENKELYFPDGTYLFNNEIKFINECHLNLGHATIKANSQMDYFISCRRESQATNYSYNSYIKGGIIDCNYLVNVGITAYKCYPFKIMNLKLQNILVNGIQTTPFEKATTPDGTFTVSNITIENEGTIEGTSTAPNAKAINDNGFDNFFDEISIVNFKYAISTIAGRFSNGNCWIRSRDLLEESRAFYLQGYDISISNWAIDTYRYGFTIDAVDHGAIINNLLWITNSNVYTENLQSQFPRIIFNIDNANKIIKLDGLKLRENTNISFSAIDMPQSSFINVWTPHNFDISNIAHFRNDNYLLDKIKNITRLETSQIVLDDTTNYNNLETGVYTFSHTNDNPTGTGAPPRGFGILFCINSGGTTSNNKLQILIPFSNTFIMFRTRVANTWSQWYKNTSST